MRWRIPRRTYPSTCSGKATSRANPLSRKSTFDDTLYLLCGGSSFAGKPRGSPFVRAPCPNPANTLRDELSREVGGGYATWPGNFSRCLANDSVPVAASGYTWPVPDFVFNAFVTLLVVVDPLGLAPIFAALTQGSSEKRRRETAIRGTLLGAGILLVFALAGDALLGALGIGLPAF